jgi:hypothetical protein
MYQDAVNRSGLFGDDLCVIGNGDIAFTQQSIAQIAEHLKPKAVFALSRTELGKAEPDPLDYQQDAWAFRGRLPTDIGDYPFGCWGSDNRFAHELDAAGWQVLNPSKTIKTFHVHGSGYRTHMSTDAHRVPPPSLYFMPHELGELPVYRRVG